MTMYGYEDPRSIFSEQNRQSAGTRTPREILADIREKELREITEFSDCIDYVDTVKVEFHSRFRHLLQSIAALEARICELEG